MGGVNGRSPATTDLQEGRATLPPVPDPALDATGATPPEAPDETGPESTDETAGQTPQKTDPPEETEAQDVAGLPEWARAELTRARNDAAKYRTRARDSVTEAETLAARVAELETARREEKVARIVETHALTTEDVDLFFPDGAPLDQLEKIAEALGQRRTAGVLPREGTGAAARPGQNPDAAFARSLFTP